MKHRSASFITPITAAAATAALLAGSTPATVGWRDSGEFLLSGLFLDIPHPAGFPFYSMAANLMSLLTAGPAAFRVHLFSVFCCAAIAFVAMRLIGKLCLAAGMSRLISTLLPLSAWCMLVSCEPFIRAGLTAEVYGLHALLVLLVADRLFDFRTGSDVRSLYAAAFIAGLGVANHVAIVGVGVVCACMLLPLRRISIRKVAISVLFAAVGVSAYAYLPARASTYPPLDTGAPTSVTRIFRHMTDARDRDLRAPRPQAEGAAARTLPVSMVSDLGRVFRVLLFPLGAIGLAALIAGVFRFPFLFAPLAASFLTTLVFFSNWDLDPFVSALSVLSLAAAAAPVTLLPTDASRFSRNSMAILTLICAVMKTAVTTPTHLGILRAHAGFSIPADAAEDLLESIPKGGVLITEPSWFVTRYLQAVEGVRQEVVVLYTPSILFPEYFAPIQVTGGSAPFIGTGTQFSTEPDIQNLIKLINIAAPITPIYFEPTSVAFTPLAEIMIFDQQGRTFVQKGRPGEFDPSYPAARARKVRRLLDAANNLTPSLRDDTRNYAEVLTAHELLTFAALGKRGPACEFASGVCPTASSCDTRLWKARLTACRTTP